MPYAYVQQINHVFDTDHLKVYVTFRHQMQRSEIPQASPPVYDWYPSLDLWLIEADEVPVVAVASEWLDEFTLLLTSDEVLIEPTGVTLAYDGPDEKLCYRWGKQIEPWGPRASYAGYPTTPAPHNSTHENGGADEINIASLSGLAADTQHSYVDRGDPAAWDYQLANLTTDGAWHDLDLHTLVPAEAVAVKLLVRILDNAASSVITFRKKGNVNTYNAAFVRTQVANINIEGDLLASCSTDRIIQYLATNTVFTGIYILVRGWFF